MGKIKMCCPHCGSNLVTKDALVMWDIATQDWQVVSVLDNGNCEACGAELRHVNDVPLLENDDAGA
ncbi:hypothetical protein [Burkholderia cenocepacia]|uniref:hypothetical protein n=1 Tax=Burkholderia cenocepacia TaxID=95486 RepID=UPI002ABDC861|nr:hypothetical protein [Burkholderia cenocepacia]